MKSSYHQILTNCICKNDYQDSERLNQTKTLIITIQKKSNSCNTQWLHKHIFVPNFIYHGFHRLDHTNISI